MMLEKFTNILQFCFEVLFRWADSSLAKWAAGFLLTGLFIGGLLHWGIFLDWTNNKFDIQDWHIHVGPYLDFLTKALRSGQFPMYADSPYMIPSEYLSRQNRPFSPQILLLYFVEPATYVLLNVWLFYTIGFAGLLLIRKKYSLSFISFLPIFLLFNLNGHIVAHLGSGHFEWVGYFLLPFFILLVLEILEEEHVGRKWLFYMALIMLGINLQGAAHFFIYCMGFLLLLGIFQPRFFSIVFRAVIVSALVSMIRILPPALQFVGGTGLESLTGFDSVLEIFQVLINQSSRGYWEKTYYVGLLGFVFIFYFGIIQHWMKDERHHPLYLPSLVMTFFSIGIMYLPFFNSGIPFLDSQRAVSRFIIVPLVFIIMLAGIQFQSFLNVWTQKAWEKGAMVVLGLALMAYDLFLNTRIWSLDNVSSSMRSNEVIEVSVATYSYPFYETILILGSACTVISLGVLIFLTFREKKSEIK